ncbi:3-oxoadipate enol-lactonase [Noviherbaspirillum humi]|uniref:3-oxoadipate enol-lactonase n=1 Tax=Noviherbaspirillum humi TaxID=1688639 RepID=A0A239M426_9BURK|nr:3-oxoadipate enol-lactonase [Noviherbaspirillum humi]SNT36982.1 3-oxoadipate enol-lactonase [Noviherbaspirillum humi]
MPHIQAGDIRLHYRIDGREGAPWLILCNSLGTTLDMWAPQMAQLQERFRVLRYDTRGHGQSDVTSGPYNVAQLGQDVINLMDALQIQRAHFCGLSMGGMTGMWLGIHHPQRLQRLVLCNTAAKIGTPEAWNARIDAVMKDGMAPVVPAVLERWFTKRYLDQGMEQVEPVRQMLLSTNVEGYAANCGAVRDMDQRDAIKTIAVPTLVIAGTHDQATSAAEGRAVADAIPHAQYVKFDAAHLSNWELPQPFTDTLIEFLSK